MSDLLCIRAAKCKGCGNPYYLVVKSFVLRCTACDRLREQKIPDSTWDPKTGERVPL